MADDPVQARLRCHRSKVKEKEQHKRPPKVRRCPVDHGLRILELFGHNGRPDPGSL